MLHSKQVKSPTSKYTVTSPRKVTHIQSKVALQKDPPPETVITQSKKMIIEANYNVLEQKPYEQLFQKVKSGYSPETVRIKSVTSRINSPNLAKKVSEEYTSSKVDFMQQRTRGQSSKLSAEGSSGYYQDRDKENVPVERLQGIRSMTSIVKRINVPALYTTPDDIYDGQFNQKGQYDGSGRYTFKACGVIYQGQFLNGEISGYGRLLYQSPRNIHPVIYQGQFLHAKKHGQGVYYYQTPTHYYKGQWQNDMKQGEGVYESPEQTYQGSWSKNKKHGRGKLVNRKNNTTFTGMFINDYFTQGEILYANGDVYVGTFHLNKKQGTGTYHYSSRNQVYTGQFANDLRHGKGMVKMANGDEFSGVWRHGRVDQSMNCTYKWANGAVFSGWFKNGVPDKGTVKNQRQEYQYTSTASFIAY